MSCFVVVCARDQYTEIDPLKYHWGTVVHIGYKWRLSLLPVISNKLYFAPGLAPPILHRVRILADVLIFLDVPSLYATTRRS